MDLQKQAEEQKISKRPTFYNVILLIVALIIGAFFAEVGVRFFAPQYKKTFRFQPVVGITRIPNSTFTYIEPGTTNRVAHQVNSDGFKTPEIIKPKPEKVFRILLLGDSMTEAIQVPDKDSFRYKIEELLNRREDNVEYEVVNLGYSGFGTAQEYLVLREFGLSYEPDLVILMFYADNDVANNSAELETGNSKPFFDIIDGELRQISVPQKSTSNELFSLITDYFVLPRFAYDKYRTLRQRNSSVIGPEVDVMNEIDIRASVYLDQSIPAWDKSWDITFKLLQETNSLSKSVGADFLVIGIPAGRQVVEEWISEYYVQYGELSEFINLELPEEKLSKNLASSSVPYFPLYESFKTETDNINLYLENDGHLSLSGHDLVAKEMFELLNMPNLLVK